MLPKYPEEVLNLYEPSPVVTCLMKKMDYNFRENMGPNYGKGVWDQPMPPMPEGNDIDY